MTRRQRVSPQRWAIITAASAASLVLAAAPAFAVSAAPAVDGMAAAPAPPGPNYPVIASGLDNPRGLTFAPNGDLYVAEAGHGGTGACIPSADNPDVEACLGATGAITRIHDGTATRVVAGLPSVAAQVATKGGQVPPGAQASGPSDVAVVGTNQIVFTIGLGSDPANRDSKLVPTSGTAHLLGTLSSSAIPGDASGVTQLADIAAFEGANNPVPPAAPDSNPNAVIADGSGYAVVDAGGNDILAVDSAGTVSMMATFPSAKKCPPPPVTPQAVPTSVARGADGALYVGELTGFPFCEGGASIFKVENGTPTVYAAGLTNVTGLAFGDDGTLYAVEIAQHGLQKGPIGAIIAIPPGGGSTMADYDVLAAGLFAPYGIAVKDGFAYVTTGSILPVTAGGGSVTKISLTPPPPPTSTPESAAPTSAAPSSESVAATTTAFSILPGSTGDALPPSSDMSLWAWLLAGVLALLVAAFVALRIGRRRTGGSHA